MTDHIKATWESKDSDQTYLKVVRQNKAV